MKKSRKKAVPTTTPESPAIRAQSRRRQLLDRMVAWQQSTRSNLSQSQLHYLFSICLMVCMSLVLLIALVVDRADGAPTRTMVGWIFAYVFMTAPPLFDAIKWYQQREGLVLTKVLVAGGAVIAYAVSLGDAAQQINAATGVSPSNFILSSSLIALFLLPLTLGKAMALIAAPLTVILPFVMILLGVVMIVRWAPIFQRQFVRAEEWQPVGMMAFRAVWIISLLALLFGLYNQYRDNMKEVMLSLSGQIVYQLEMYDQSECRHVPGTRVANIGDGLMLVATKADERPIEFDVAQCDTLACQVTPADAAVIK